MSAAISARERHLAWSRRDNVAGTHAPSGPALAMPFIEDEWWSAENEGRMVDLSNCLQVSIQYIYLIFS